ncbi:MAG: serine/threonine-protein kinase [Planctomycetota bacterium]|nr:serine/threonine-protein kinase [Planctomycetota bacterium]
MSHNDTTQTGNAAVSDLEQTIASASAPQDDTLQGNLSTEGSPQQPPSSSSETLAASSDADQTVDIPGTQILPTQQSLDNDPGRSGDQTLDLIHNADTLQEGAAPAGLRTDGGAASQRKGHSITRFLAEGGLGKVFVAKDEQLGREVVMKTLRSSASEGSETILRFRREAQINSQLEHPNIVPIYQAGNNDEDNQPYYTMKFIRGREFKELIDDFHKNGDVTPEARAMEFRRLLTLFVNTCHALSYAHNRGVVHRDIKPENIAVGEFEELLVLDWGIAKILHQPEEDSDQREIEMDPNMPLEKTQQGRIVGTPAYMAPEQASGQNDLVAGTADIYALGAVLFRILTGKVPHRPLHDHSQAEVNRWRKQDQTKEATLLSYATANTGATENTMKLLTRIHRGDIAPADIIAPGVPLPLSAICQKAMAVEPASRYQDATALANDINHWLADEPVSVFQDPWLTRVRRWTKRHQTLVVGATTTVAATLVGLMAVVFVVMNANAQLDNKNTQLASLNSSLKNANAQLDNKNTQLASLNSSLKKANQAERLARQQALERLRDARVSADSWLLDLSGDLQNYPGLVTARKGLLQKAASYYKSFTTQPTSDPQLQIEYARCEMRLGDIWRLLNDTDRSKTAYQKAAQSIQALEASIQKMATVQILRAASHTGLGLAYSAQESTRTQALNEFDQAIQILTPLENLPTDGRNALATAQWGAALIHDMQGDPKTATQLLTTATAAFQTLAEEEESPKFIARRLNTLNDLARVLESQEQHAEAAAAHNQSIQFYSQLLEAHPARPDYFDERDQKMAELENALRHMDRAETALVVDDALIQDYSSRFQESLAKTLRYLENRALTHVARWQLLTNLARPADTQQALQLAIADYQTLVASGPESEKFDESRARYQQSLTDLQKAIGENPAPSP